MKPDNRYNAWTAKVSFSLKILNSRLAQLAERCAVNADVIGSKPISGASKLTTKIANGVATLVKSE